jgi:putative toxin-antitoxin system antitoxin component (TIGR02293 family)
VKTLLLNKEPAMPRIKPTCSAQFRQQMVELAQAGQSTGIDSEAAVQILKAGLAASELDWASHALGLHRANLAQMVGLDSTTATNLTGNNKALPLLAAERLLRLLELDAIACATFESAAAARGWLTQQHPMLGSESPFQAAKTSYGAKQVKDLLASIKYSGAV